MKPLLTLFFLLTACHVVTAQNPYGIKGKVADTASDSKLHNASVSVLHAKDSTLIKFTRADANGLFSIAPLKKGNFILLVTYPDYADYVSLFSLDSLHTNLDLGQVNMKLKATLLKEVLIKGQGAAIKIKGDTTEFNAASYTIQPNDKVEDLLKKLPGIQVDKDGKITAQGKSVPKVLVDGEEFFGDDPTLVTKNLRADMVDKVQYFEKSSDQAAFTGVDDGEKTPTINIKLKEDKKSGYFGKVDVGIGTKDFYDSQILFNRFKARQKFSIFGTIGNDGITGLNWDDANKYGGGNNMEVSGDMIFFTGNGDDIDGFEGRYYGEGIPIARNGGVHYDNKWNNDKESINTNYKIGSLRVKLNKNTIDQNNLANDVINTNSDQEANRYIFRQKLDATYNIKLDTSSNLKLMIDGTLKNNDNLTDYNSIGLRGNGSLLNESKRSIDNHGNEDLFNISAFYTRKLKKAGRNFSINLSEKINNKTSNGYLYSENDFYDATGSLTSSELVDQYKTNEVKLNSFSSNFTYNEPITKFSSLVLNYGFTLSSNESDKRSFNRGTAGAYTNLDLDYSNDFDARQITNQGGAIFNYKKQKTVLGFGTRINAVNFDQYEALSGQRYKRSYLNWVPQLNYQYKFSTQKSLRFNYYGNTNQPTIEQLQPVKVNTDPLNIPVGNPDLRPSYYSNFNLNFNSYKVLTNRSLYLSGSFGFTDNQIVSDITTDAGGRSIRKAVNLKDKMPYNFYFYSYFGRKIKPLGVDIGLNLRGNGSTNFSYINGDLNKTTSTSISPRLSISRYKEKFEMNVGFGPSYNAQEASLQQERSNRGWGSQGNAYISATIPWKIRLQADADYTYTPSSRAFNNSFEQTILNASISKSFFKKEELKATVKVNDLLNQNRGFERFANANAITQTFYNNISRYFMFSLVWDFNKMGGGMSTQK